MLMEVNNFIGLASVTSIQVLGCVMIGLAMASPIFLLYSLFFEDQSNPVLKNTRMVKSKAKPLESWNSEDIDRV